MAAAIVHRKKEHARQKEQPLLDTPVVTVFVHWYLYYRS